MLKNKKLWLMVFTLMCVIGIGVCVIVDYALNNSITWAMYPILSVILAYFIIIPLFIKKHGIVLSLSSLTILIIPFLYFIEKITTVKDWFYPIALPISIVSIIGIWISYLLIKFLKINEWYKIAILIFIWGAIISPIINYIADDLEFLSFQNFINIFACTVGLFACIILGYVKHNLKK